MIPAGQQGGSAGTGPGCTPSGCLGCSFAHHSQCWLDGRARACHGVRQMGQQQFASLEELTAGCERVAEPGTSAHKCAWVCACLVCTQRGVQSMSSYSAATCGQHLQPLPWLQHWLIKAVSKVRVLDTRTSTSPPCPYCPSHCPTRPPIP